LYSWSPAWQLLTNPKLIAHRFFEMPTIVHSCPPPKIVSLGHCWLLKNSWLRHWCLSYIYEVIFKFPL
jgi:hypothetical protein